jgi:hypothetical protein
VSGVLWAALGVVGTLGMTAIGDMVSEEARDRLDHLPHAILRLAARRLDPAQRGFLYEEVWLPDLAYYLKGDEARPVTRLYHGIRFALSMLVAARYIARQLGRPVLTLEEPTISAGWMADPRIRDALVNFGLRVFELRQLAAELSGLEQSLDATAEKLRCLHRSRVISRAKLRRRLRRTEDQVAVLRSQGNRVEQNMVEHGLANSLAEFLAKIETTAGTVAFQEVESALAQVATSQAKGRIRTCASAFRLGSAFRRPRD